MRRHPLCRDLPIAKGPRAVLVYRIAKVRRARALQPLSNSVTGIDPPGDVIEEVLYGIRVLAGSAFARCARRPSVRSALDDNKIFILAGRHFVMNFAVPDEVMCAHRGDQDRNRDAFHGAIR